MGLSTILFVLLKMIAKDKYFIFYWQNKHIVWRVKS